MSFLLFDDIHKGYVILSMKIQEVIVYFFCFISFVS